MATVRLHLTGDPAADRLLATDPFALLVGMVLDQQIPLERAFSAPAALAARLGAPATAASLAAMDPDELVAHFRTPPALHRFPASMAARVQEVARVVVAEYGGDAARIWTTAETGQELARRLGALPGFGAAKAKIFLALIGKQLGVRPPGWQEACRPYGEPGTRLSVADIDSPEALVAVRDHKRAMKAAAKAGTAR